MANPAAAAGSGPMACSYPAHETGSGKFIPLPHTMCSLNTLNRGPIDSNSVFQMTLETSLLPSGLGMGRHRKVCLVL